MTIPLHQTRLAINSPDDGIEVEAGMPVTLEVEVSCSGGCDLSGRLVTVATPDGPLPAAVAGNNGRFFATFSVAAPPSVGTYEWAVQMLRFESPTVVDEESAIRQFALKVIPHSTSLAVWDVTSPVPVLGTLRLKTGAKCSAGCALSGCRVEAFDEHGSLVGAGQIGDTPLAGTTGLYWTEMDVQAPAAPGVLAWTVSLKTAGLELAHEAATGQFSFRAEPPPDHRVTVELTRPDDHAPLDDAEVRLGQYVSTSNAQGVAIFHLPAGSYDLTIRKDGYDTVPLTVLVADEMTVRVEAVKTLTQAEREDRLARFVDVEWG